jgi:hypothetical protein
MMTMGGRMGVGDDGMILDVDREELHFFTRLFFFFCWLLGRL